MGNRRLQLSKCNVTLAMEDISFPPSKITSDIFTALKERAFKSPKTNRTASRILLLPLPFGPVTTINPLSKSMVTLRGPKDLKFLISSFLRYTNHFLSIMATPINFLLYVGASLDRFFIYYLCN